MSDALADKLRARIQRDGPISFHDFMDAALFDESLGYYAKGPAIGPAGGGSDFFTSASFASFRFAMANLAEVARRALGSSTRVVELGAGTGDIARAVAPRVKEYVTVDRSPGLRAKQLAAGATRAVPSAAELSPAPSLVFGNEVLDALPVRRVVGGPREDWLEVFVDVGPDGRFRERLRPLVDAHVAARLAREGVSPRRGQVLDVAPALEDFVRDVARLADPGFLVLIDYGDPAPRLYAPTRLNGTLAVYKAHGRFQDAFEDVGDRDITADVDFTAVEHAARAAGMEPLGLIRQSEFLEALGVDMREYVAKPSAMGSAFEVFAARRGTDASLPGFL